MPYANNKGADQPAHPCSLISAFVVRCLDSIIAILVKSKISRLWLVSVPKQGGLSPTWSKTPKTGFPMTWLSFQMNDTHCSMSVDKVQILIEYSFLAKCFRIM